MSLEQVKTICSLGTGAVGPGIALTFALAGYPVNMYGRSDQSIGRSFTVIQEILNKFLQKNLVEKPEILATIARIKGVTTLEAAAEGADFVIESIVEDLLVKQEVFAQMERYCSEDTIFASSTSGLIPTAIAENLKIPDRFIVAHFWNPPHLIPLVEVVPGEKTSQRTTDTTVGLLMKVGKKPVLLKREALGFIGNRLQFAMLREAMSLVNSGIATKETVDTTIKYALGRRLSTTGPFESADLSGLDVIHNISSYLFKDLSNSTDIPSSLRENVEAGNLGGKTGSGFYEWTDDSLMKIKKLREEDLLEWLNKDKMGYLE